MNEVLIEERKKEFYRFILKTHKSSLEDLNNNLYPINNVISEFNLITAWRTTNIYGSDIINEYGRNIVLFNIILSNLINDFEIQEKYGMMTHIHQWNAYKKLIREDISNKKMDILEKIISEFKWLSNNIVNRTPKEIINSLTHFGLSNNVICNIYFDIYYSGITEWGLNDFYVNTKLNSKSIRRIFDIPRLNKGLGKELAWELLIGFIDYLEKEKITMFVNYQPNLRLIHNSLELYSGLKEKRIDLLEEDDYLFEYYDTIR